MPNIIELLQIHAKKHPDLLAINKTSYKELVEKVGKIAFGLQKLGIEKGDRVIIFLPFSLELYLAMFSVQSLGAVAVFLDSWARKDQLSIAAEIVNPKAMISFDLAFSLCKDVDIGTKIDPILFQQLQSGDNELAPISVSPDQTALITFTTGSSGRPKGANRTHEFLLSQHEALDKVIPYPKGSIDLPVFPIFALNNLACGITTILPTINLAAPDESDGDKLIDSLLLSHATSCTLSPSLFIKVARSALKKNILLPNLTRVITGGAPVSFDDVERFQQIAPIAEVMILYGSTEVEPIAHIEGKAMLSYPIKKEGVLVGEISNTLTYKFIKICHEPIMLGLKEWSEWEVQKGEIGELVVSGKHVCKSYYNDNESFFKAKIEDKEGVIWHRTGDVGMLDEKGSLWLVGRVHNTIVREGFFLFPVQAEILLKSLPFVKEAAFLGIDGKTFAVVSLKEEEEGNAKTAIRSILEKNAIPVDAIEVVAKIPMDPRHHSKVEYSELRRQLCTQQ